MKKEHNANKHRHLTVSKCESCYHSVTCSRMQANNCAEYAESVSSVLAGGRDHISVVNTLDR